MHEGGLSSPLLDSALSYSLTVGAARSICTTLRHSATSRLHGSWQSNGIAVAGVADPGPFKAVVWSCNGSNFSGGNFVDATVPRLSRFQRIVRKHPLSDRQKFPTTLSICSSEIFAATRYIPDCRSNVSRNGVVCSRPFFQAAKTASLPG